MPREYVLCIELFFMKELADEPELRMVMQCWLYTKGCPHLVI